MPSQTLLRVIGGPQNYAWGKLGSSSTVAQFAHANDPTVSIDESKPYAELWMGTHPKVPTIIANSGEKLADLISSDPAKFLGTKVAEKFHLTNELPFLFKVLSIEKVLSIQAHPDKELAKKLRAADPTNYPDDNHKPEMAIAITPFEAFCGFKPLLVIKDHLEQIPEFRELVGTKIAQSFINSPSKDSLKLLFAEVMNSSDEDIEKYSQLLVERSIQEPQLFSDKRLPPLIQKLNDQFPNDIGLFCGCLMLNHCILSTGEAMFLQACEPHAYISGDIMECMAASDNVIRAGFTPKFKDVKTLVNYLTYSTNNVEEQKQPPAPFPRGTGNAKFSLYDPPIDEFSVLQVEFSESNGKALMKGIDGPSIAIVTKGKGSISDGEETLDAFAGAVYYIAPNTETTLNSVSDDFTLYRAYCEA